MTTIIINGIPVANTNHGYIDSYFAPSQRRLRDIAEAVDVEYEEIYGQTNTKEDEKNIEMEG